MDIAQGYYPFHSILSVINSNSSNYFQVSDSGELIGAPMNDNGAFLFLNFTTNKDVFRDMFDLYDPIVDDLDIDVYPNPCTVSVQNMTLFDKNYHGISGFKVFSYKGELIYSYSDGFEDYIYVWDLKDFYGKYVSRGIYILQYETERGSYGNKNIVIVDDLYKVK